MKILVITQKVDENDDVLGFFTNWIKALANKAEEVNVIALAKGGFELPKNVNVHSLGKEYGASKVIQAIKFYIYAFKILRKVDGIFVHMAPEYVRALYPLNIFFKKPIVMWYAHIHVSKTARWALDHVNFVCTPSKESFSYISPKVRSTGHGINTELFKPTNIPVEADLISISRISKVKRIEVLIEALRILKEQGKKITTNIYGKPARAEDDEYLKELKKLVTKYELKDYVFWKGGVANKEAPKIYPKHKIFIRLQGGGGYGKTELEAMSIGLPAILPTPVYKKDLKDFADDLYFIEDNAVELAQKITKVLGWSETRLNEYKETARKLVVDKHNIENVAKEIVNLLEKATLKATI